MKFFEQERLDANFDNSDDHEFVKYFFRINPLIIYIKYLFFTFLPVLELSPPIKTLSGLIKSSIAVPSARNSGFDITSKFTSEL